MSLRIILNGQTRSLEGMDEPQSLEQVISQLALKGDRVAVELNGSIVPRTRWSQALVADQDRLEVVHFVGGGAGEA